MMWLALASANRLRIWLSLSDVVPTATSASSAGAAENFRMIASVVPKICPNVSVGRAK
jgi:hypothetical protein